MPRPAMIEVQNVNVPGSAATVNAEKYHAMRKALLNAPAVRGPVTLVGQDRVRPRQR